jgi:hypothetical protein
LRIHRRRPLTSWLVCQQLIVFTLNFGSDFHCKSLGESISNTPLASPPTIVGQGLPFTISYRQSDVVKDHPHEENVSHVHMTGKTVMVHICKKN